MRKEYTNTYKTKIVEKYKKSKMRISEFCRTNEIPTSTFNRWLLEDKINLRKSSNFGEISTNILDNNNITDVIKETETIKLEIANIEVNFKANSDKKILQSILGKINFISVTSVLSFELLSLLFKDCVSISPKLDMCFEFREYRVYCVN